MSFRGKTFLFLLAFSLLLPSCSWWGDENVQSTGIALDTSSVIKFGDINCIKNTGAFFADYFYGRSSVSEIRDMQKCVENTLDSMFDLAYKNDEVGFNRTRIKNVLESVISQNRSYDLDELADLIFRLKRFFVGGGKDSFFKEEWERFRPDLAEVANALIASHKSSKTIFFSGKDKNLLEREEFYHRLSNSFKAIDRVKNKHPKTLEIKEIESLVSVLLKVSDLDHFTPLAMTARKIIYPTEEIFEKEQGVFLKTVWDVFEIQTRAREISFTQGILVGESSADVIKALGILTDRLQVWSGEYPETFSFSTDHIKQLIDQMYDIGFLNDIMENADPINETVENVFKRIFGSTKIKQKDFTLLREIFNGWAQYYPRLLVDLDAEWAKTVYSVLVDEELKTGTRTKEMAKMLDVFDQPNFISGPSTPIHILYDKRRTLTPEEVYLDKSLKQLFLALAEPVMKAYNPELNEKTSGIGVIFNTKGLDRLLIDFRPIGLELGFINRYSCNSSTRIFTESNLLTKNANGDGFISLIEAAEWLGTMIVTSSLTDHVFSRIEKECAYKGEHVYGYPFYNRECFKKSMFNNKENIENYFPGFLTYMDILRSDSRRKVFEEQMGGWVNYAKSYYAYNELDPNFFETVFMNQMNACFQVKDKEAYLDFPLSRAEFNATIATLIYVENFYSSYDTTGFKSLWADEPQGPDLIIDGGEVSVFARDKVNEDNTRTIAKAIRSESWLARRYGHEERWVNTLRGLPEWAVKMDRQRLTDIIKNIMSDTLVVDPLEQNYCEQVMNSAMNTGTVAYDTEARLQCPAVE